MAVITPVKSEEEGSSYLVVWEAVTTANHTGTGVGAGGLGLITVQAFGTWGGATLSIEGSMDGGTTWAIVDDVAGDPASLTGNGWLAIQGTALLLRARLTTVGVGADVDCYMLGHGIR